jgi:hypothetical protein
MGLYTKGLTIPFQNNSKPFETLGDTINMSSTFVQNFSPIDNDHKELSLSK